MMKPTYGTALTLKRKSLRLYYGSGQVLVGLLDFKSSDGQRCPWWVRFPCTSANIESIGPKVQHGTSKRKLV